MTSVYISYLVDVDFDKISVDITASCIMLLEFPNTLQLIIRTIMANVKVCELKWYYGQPCSVKLFVTSNLAELWNGFGTQFVGYKNHGENTIVQVYLSID
jgi:hypothetical protein